MAFVFFLNLRNPFVGFASLLFVARLRKFINVFFYKKSQKSLCWIRQLFFYRQIAKIRQFFLKTKSQKSLCWIRQPFFWSPGCEDSPNFILFLISEIPLLDSPAPFFFCRQVAKIRQIKKNKISEIPLLDSPAFFFVTRLRKFAKLVFKKNLRNPFVGLASRFVLLPGCKNWPKKKKKKNHCHPPQLSNSTY
jgi:hypothetical protein